ncbi:MAG: DUF1189 family protein [bacterium]
MEIFKKIGQSVYGLDLYKSLKTGETKEAVKYYFKFILILAVIVGLLMGFYLIVNIRLNLTSENIAKAVAVYPADLKIKLENGQFSTNSVGVARIPMPKDIEFIKNSETYSKFDNFAVIDPTIKAFPPSILTDNKTFLFITKDSIITEKDGALEVVSVADRKDTKYEFNHDEAVRLAPIGVSIINFASYFAPILVFIAFFIIYALGFIPLYLLALLVWLVLIIKRNNGGYMHAFRVTLHAITLVYLINIVLGFFISSPSWPWTAVVTLLVVFLNLRESHSEI